MKKSTYLPFIRAVGMLLLFIMSLSLKAQTANNPVLTWDQEVGCIEYDDKEQRVKEHHFVENLEQIEEGKCIRFCEDSVVNYTFSANNIANVSWDATGGTVLPGSSTNNASVHWGSYGSGSLILTITYVDNTVEVKAICVEKILKPIAYFEIDGVDPHQREFCVGTPISFNNLSTDNGGTAIVSYMWDFGDGNFSNTFEPVHTYTTPGDYLVELTVTNSCNCSSKYKFEIKITEDKVVEIFCPSVVCEKSKQTYSVKDECGGEWKVIGGNIIANYGTSIEVVWDSVDPADGFGYVSYLSKCSCPYWNTVKIPVIVQKGVITGPYVICQGKQGKFTMPQWPTTDFEWFLNGDPYDPMLVYTDQRNEIIVDGLSPGSYVLSVKYRNTLIDKGECMGEAEIKFEIVENVEIITDEPLTVCANTVKNFYTSNGNSVAWEITKAGTVVHSSYGASTSFNFTDAGAYVVTANNNGCISDPIVIDVIANPIITGVITGPLKVCKSTPYSFELTENEPGAIYVWSIDPSQGSVIGSNSGATADFSFISLPATISVIKQYVKNGVICSSEPVIFTVNEIVVNPNIINNSGLSLFCTSSTYNFTADLNGVDVDLIEWSLSPANFGSIIDGVNSNTVTIGINEASSTYTGELILTVTKCGKKTSKVFTVKIIKNLAVNIGTIASICPADSTISVPLTFTPTGVGGGTLEFYYNDGSPYPTPFVGDGIYTIPQNFVGTPSGSVSGYLKVVWISPNGCTISVTAVKQVTILPLNTVELFATNGNVVCPTNPFNLVLSATFSTGISSSSIFYWYYNGIAISGAPNSPTLTMTNSNGLYQGAGQYTVKVQDINGCWITSNITTIYESCGSGPGNPVCTFTYDPIPMVDYAWSDCNTINFTTTYNTSISNVEYYQWSSLTSGLLLGANNITGASATVTEPGSYLILLKVKYYGCPLYFDKIVEVRKHYKPQLRYSVTCQGNNTYSITLMNNSKMFDINPSLVNIQYLDGSSSVIASNVASHTITGVAPGTYTFTLKLSTSQTTTNGTAIPTCEETITIVIDGPPALNFTIPNGSTYCANDPIMLVLPGGTMTPGYSYRWIFNGTSYIASSPNTEISFASAGTYEIKLEVTNQYGCVFVSSSKFVNITKANFKGKIIPNPADFCEGSATPLSFQPAIGTPIPSDIIWMKDNMPVGVGLTYLPSVSGSYWPILIDANGCKDNQFATKPVMYKLRKPPYASINGSTSICYGETTTLTGIFTDSDVEHRWVGPSLPSGYGSWVTGTTNLSLNITGLAPGTYNYTFEVRDLVHATCVGSFTMTVIAHPMVTTPNITYTKINCQPYTLQLTASGPSVGTYNWSNGMIGQTIEVTQGGAYSVTYTAPTGCSATGYIQAPHNPERSLWVVPSGCYDLCLNQGEYLLGPLGIYDAYEWSINNGVTQSGSNTYIPNQPIIMAGHYRLDITQEGCTFSSNEPHITASKDCDIKPCKIEAGIRDIKPIDGGGYVFSVYFYNPYPYPITINLSSLYGYGFYSPSTITLTPGGNAIYPLYFYTNSSYIPGSADGLVIQMQDCMTIIDFKFPKEYYPFEKNSQENVELVNFTLNPNPTYETTTSSFNIGTEYQEAQSISVFDTTGVLRHKQNISGKTGNVILNVSHLPAGVYTISLQADGVNVAHQKLIKK